VVARVPHGAERHYRTRYEVPLKCRNNDRGKKLVCFLFSGPEDTIGKGVSVLRQLPN